MVCKFGWGRQAVPIILLFTIVEAMFLLIFLPKQVWQKNLRHGKFHYGKPLFRH